MTLGSKLRELRNKRNLSLRALGEKAMVDFSQIARVEKEHDTRTGGCPAVTIDALARLCNALDYDLISFLEETGYTTRPQDEAELIEIYRSLDDDKKATILDAARSLR